MDNKLTVKTAKFTSLENLYVYGTLHSIQKLRDLEFEEKVSSIYKKIYSGFEPTHLNCTEVHCSNRTKLQHTKC